jgi:hypothetical protein
MNNSEFGPIPSDYVLAGMIDLMHELITRNRAYEKVLRTLVSEDDLQVRLKQVESLRPSVEQPPIYTDLRAGAIAAAQGGNLPELLSIVQRLSERTHLWMSKPEIHREGEA